MQIYVFLFIYAAVLAALEVEIEGAHGWAERIPTFYRVETRAARLFGVLAGGRPLTGYHALMIPFVIMSFHLPFVYGLHWSVAEETNLLADFLVWTALWDGLWFVINPAYGWRRFRRSNVWWHDHPWLFGMPIDYSIAVVASTVLRGLARYPDVSSALTTQGEMLLVFASGTALLLAASPWIHRWHRRLHDPETDQRHLADIRPPPGEPR